MAGTDKAERLQDDSQAKWKKRKIWIEFFRGL
jgi:hypothetical protein